METFFFNCEVASYSFLFAVDFHVSKNMQVLYKENVKFCKDGHFSKIQKSTCPMIEIPDEPVFERLTLVYIRLNNASIIYGCSISLLKVLVAIDAQRQMKHKQDGNF